MDQFFQRAAKDLAEEHRGQWRAAPPKTCVRMAAKLAADHAREPKPKAAANLDLARAAISFEDPQVGIGWVLGGYWVQGAPPTRVQKVGARVRQTG